MREPRREDLPRLKKINLNRPGLIYGKNQKVTGLEKGGGRPLIRKRCSGRSCTSSTMAADGAKCQNNGGAGTHSTNAGGCGWMRVFGVWFWVAWHANHAGVCASWTAPISSCISMLTVQEEELSISRLEKQKAAGTPSWPPQWTNGEGSWLC